MLVYKYINSKAVVDYYKAACCTAHGLAAVRGVCTSTLVFIFPEAALPVSVHAHRLRGG